MCAASKNFGYATPLHNPQQACPLAFRLTPTHNLRAMPLVYPGFFAP
jgi:hypothetical protein